MDAISFNWALLRGSYMTAPITISAIQAAQQRIRQLVKKTPVMQSVYLEERLGIPVFLKLENLNTTGSFKIRGASNWLLSRSKSDLQAGVVAASAGNHAQGVAYACRSVGVQATIFMPESTPIIKVESTRMLGAQIVLKGETYVEAFEAASEFSKSQGVQMVHPFADPDVIAGQGTIGLEILEQCPDIKAIVAPIGGGGLMSGIACAVKTLRPDIAMYGVQSAAFASMAMSFRTGTIQQCSPSATIADGIAVKSVNPLNFEIIRTFVDDVFSVQEEDIAAAIMDLMERNHLLAEGAGAAAVAGLIQSIDRIRQHVDNSPVLCVISGGNIDVNLLQRIMTKGMIRSGRLMKVRCRVNDRPGSLAALLGKIASTGANIIEVHHDRTFSQGNYKEVTVDVTLETLNREHQGGLSKTLFDLGIRFDADA